MNPPSRRHQLGPDPRGSASSGPGTPASGAVMTESDGELSAMVQELWDKDTNRLRPGHDYRISLQVSDAQHTQRTQRTQHTHNKHDAHNTYTTHTPFINHQNVIHINTYFHIYVWFCSFSVRPLRVCLALQCSCYNVAVLLKWAINIFKYTFIFKYVYGPFQMLFIFIKYIKCECFSAAGQSRRQHGLRLQGRRGVPSLHVCGREDLQKGNFSRSVLRVFEAILLFLASLHSKAFLIISL